ncbi:MAG: 30S ribosome-binding factor RbfA [Gammaproteobacteria bacterium]|nr:30S ribosome-binding factor RbfA [Gammaproteobacteria bacterium]
MSEQSQRQQRVADLVQRELAMLIQLEVNDPRIGMVSVTGVDISRDLAYAEVYVSVLNSTSGGDDDTAGAEPAGEMDKLEIEENVKALNKAAGYLRSLLAKRLKLRTTPKLRFHYDGTISRGNKLSSLIDQALEADRKQHS